MQMRAPGRAPRLAASAHAWRICTRACSGGSQTSATLLGKSRKRKRSEEEEGEEAGPASATPSSALFSISVSKLHQSLQRGEPDLRHLVLVANTLRRLRDATEPSAPGPQPPPGRGSWLDDSDRGPGGRPPPLLPPPLAPVDQLLLSDMDASVFSSILEDLTSTDGFSNPLRPPEAQPEDRLLCGLSPEPGRTAQPGLGPLELLDPGGALLEEGLDSVFEDIDTSMYDCDPWAPGKEACPGTQAARQELADLDYLLDVLVGAEAL
ncbi:PREDICTED: SERTA domain-containing protein 1 [Gekko japonicus]|uniref:SERTA domain-containing protein 1 n=1 Tax=Gekko japonicus TaxID=146911 RepID=A0ABM1JNU9_GEKJA|nr:PREDICTED: SERTA domain-containing protein 1 [Gekko japonicus]